MKSYTPDAPLFFIHIPKTGGVSTRAVFRNWFGHNLVGHYADGSSGAPPPVADIAALHSRQTPLLVYGHFNSYRGYGIEDYYPQASQRVTVVRDPWQRALSGYFYRKQMRQRQGRSEPPETALIPLKERFLSEARKIEHFFPRGINTENYKEIIERHFVAIGTTEKLGPFLARAAARLGRDFDARQLEHKNTSVHDEEIAADFHDAFMETHRLEYLIYDHVSAMDPDPGQVLRR